MAETGLQALATVKTVCKLLSFELSPGLIASFVLTRDDRAVSLIDERAKGVHKLHGHGARAKPSPVKPSNASTRTLGIL